MATTATLNGGPTGGLHATPTLIHTDNPPQEETCRVDSNSSFESGHEEHLQIQGGTNGGAGEGEDPDTPNNNSSAGGNNNAYFIDYSEASSKKRRKQSRPVRIPLDPSDSEGGGAAPEGEGVVGHTQQQQRHHVPLNLSSRNDNSSSEDETKPSSLRANRRNSFSENDKTDLLAGQGTKDLPNRVGSASATGSPSLPPSFSPGLFPLGAPSPFSSLFSTNLNLYSQQHSQQQGQQNPGPAGTPTSSSSAGSVSALQNLPPHRIFNPEAYCDLCNKEFCNKYFLKTHKANKHGVYSEMSPGMAMGQVIAANSPSNTPFLTGAAILSSAALVNANSQPGGASNPHHGTEQSNSSGSASGTGTSALAKGTPTGSISSEIPFSLPPFSLEKGAGSSNGAQQRESFCELCQKEFCNKYFLKRHKAKIHGIPADSSSTGSGRSSSGSSNQGKSGSFFNGTVGEKGLSLRDMGLEALGLEIVAKHLEEANRATDRGGGREEGEISADDEHRDGGKSPENMGESDDNSSFRVSTTNGENSCQFCLKECSSKQELINHLVKKHRLLLPSTFPPFLFPFPNLFEDQGDPEGHMGIPLIDNNGNATITGGDGDVECNLCNRTFQTVYLLRMHKSYFHPDSESPQGMDEQEGKYKRSQFMSSKHPTKKNNEGEEGDQDQDEQGFNSEHDDSNNGGSGKASPTLEHSEKRSKGKERKGMRLGEVEGRGEGTPDSDDLRRLQTMIMELNRVSSAAVAWSPPLNDAAMSAHLSLPPPLGTNMGNLGQPGSSGSATLCHICNKEFYSTYFLQQHVQHFHTGNSSSATNEAYPIVKSESPLNTMASGRSGTPSDQQSIRIKTESFHQSEISGSSGGNKKSSSVGGDTIPGGTTISPETLKERLLNPENFGQDVSSLGSGGSSSTSTFLTPGPKGSSTSVSLALSKAEAAKRPSPSLSRSYCTICHKELCNKYFMRTHMLKMHGISIESSTGLGGVTCDICNKELCSKYFLKVHKQNTHGIVEEGPSPPSNPSTPGPGGTPGPMSNLSMNQGSGANFPSLSSLTGLNLSTNSSTTSPLSMSEGIGSQSDTNSIPMLSKDSSDRYYSNVSEACPFCDRRFRSSKLLRSHLQEHGEEGVDKWKSIEQNLRRRQKGSSSSSSKQSGSYSLGMSHQSKGSSLSNTNSSKVRDRDGNKCAFCTFSTSDVDTMKSHLIKEHSSQLANRQAMSDAAAMASSLQESQSGMLLDPLTMLFQKMEGGNTKIYRCSYCPFTTSILVYLYAHERTHAGLGGTSSVGSHLGNSSEVPTFQCPMCFHTFDQPEAFQQHLIGHQMSGVLAPFFTPSATNPSGRLGFLTSPTGSGGEGSPDPRGLLSLPLLNGSASDNLYWALKTAPTLAAHCQPNGDQDEGKEITNEPAADLTTGARKKRAHAEGDTGSDLRPRKREKILRFRCSYCQSQFASKELALAHVRQVHGGKRRGVGRTSRRLRKKFRCRKRQFTSKTYQMLLVHNKLQHLASRKGYSQASNFQKMPEGRGVAQEDGQFLMQGFLLASTEEEKSNHFVPSVVYLPVREKVSHSIRVSFSLTPTTTFRSSDTQEDADHHRHHHQEEKK